MIVGGGITGALTAHAFAEAGVSVILLEAARCARGSTAASSALLLQEPDHGLGQLAERYGRARASRIWTLSRDAVRDFVATLRRLNVRCDLVARDAVYFSRNEQGVTRLRAEHRRRVDAGFPGEWLGPGAIRTLTGIAARGAIRTRGHAQFDPYRACIGLLGAAARAGAALFERSAVTRVVRRGSGVRVHTDAGHVDAARVIVATGYATPDFRPLAGRFQMYRTYAMATAVLTAAERRDIGLGDVMVWDTDRPYHYARWTADHRLLIGGGDRLVRAGARRDQQFAAGTRELKADFDAFFPALADLPIEHAWEGVFAVTPDTLPFIGAHPRYPGHLFALGYGGNGMTFGFLAARMLLEQWQGVHSADHDLFRFARTP